MEGFIMKKFFKEFKEFISKGNILDMAIGVIIAGAFSQIVTALTNKILMPLINSLLAPATGGDKIYTILWSSKLMYSADDVSKLDEAGKAALSAYQLGPDGGYYSKLFFIDWSAFIEAIINFIFIALVLFTITKIFISINKKREELKNKIKKDLENKLGKNEDKVEEVEEVKEVETPVTEPAVTNENQEIINILKEISDKLNK
jgi:large conductance mechanosensitive channel